MNIFPKYIKMGGRTALALEEEFEDYALYYRDAGQWQARVTRTGNGLEAQVVKYPDEVFTAEECSAEEYREDNAGYV